MRSLVAQLALACSLLVSGACGKDRNKCQAAVTDLTRYLQTFDLAVGPYVRPATLVVRPVTEPAAHELVLVIAPGGARFGGEPVTPATLATALEDRHDGGKAGLIVAIDEAVHWDTIVAFLQASTDAGVQRAALAFEPPSSGEPPPRSDVADRIDRAGPLRKDREEALEQSILTTFKTCKKVSHLLEVMDAATNDTQGEVLVGGIGTGLLDCECEGVDFARARSIGWHLFHRPAARVLGIGLAKDGKPLAYAGTTPWRQIGPQLTTSAPVWPSVAP